MSIKGRVCVSGVTGFIGSQVTKDLLEAGYCVHGTGRRMSDASRTAHITALPNAGTNFRAFEADLLTPGAFDAALAGCDAAIHCASPYVLDGGGDPQGAIVDPALKGTISFLESCKNVGCVKKVIVTSSVAAIADEGTNGAVVNESTWNEKSSLARLPYYYSKTVAERAAWEWAEKNPQVKLVVINPFLVIGPSMIKGLNPSVQFIKNVIDAKEFPGIVDMTYTFVDVRDVSRAHIAALESTRASGRYICADSQGAVHMRELVSILRGMGFTPKTMDLTSPILTRLTKMGSYVYPGGWVGTYIRGHFGNPVLVSNDKIRAELGVTFMDSRESVKDTVNDMIRWGHVPRPSASPA